MVQLHRLNPQRNDKGLIRGSMNTPWNHNGPLCLLAISAPTFCEIVRLNLLECLLLNRIPL